MTQNVKEEFWLVCKENESKEIKYWGSKPGWSGWTGNVAWQRILSHSAQQEAR